MKKFFYLFVLLSFLAFINPVCAEESTISYNRLDGIYYNQKIGTEIKSNLVTSFHLGDRIAYCIEPGVAINEKVYDISNDWSVTNLSDEIKDYVEKVGYYGYEYPGHNTNYYYIAAQELIWKAIRPDIEVTWTTEKNLSGNVIDISNEKNEILNLVKSHDLIPSFANKNFEGYVGDELLLTDNNKVLNLFDISKSKNHTIIKEDNLLKIKLNENKVDEEVIFFSRKYYDNAPLLVYSKGNSQKLAALRITSDKKFNIKISNKEKPIKEEVIEVPDTGIGVDVTELIVAFLSGVGLIIGAVKIH